MFWTFLASEGAASFGFKPSGEGKGQNLLVVAILHCLENLIFFPWILHLLLDYITASHIESIHMED